jgi:hypothetical protein
MANPLHVEALWTAAEFFRVMEPWRTRMCAKSPAEFDAEVRKSHVLAVLSGHDWNAAGKYPLSVWFEIYH